MKKLFILVLFASLAIGTKAYGDTKSDMMPVLSKVKAGISNVLYL